MSTTNHPPYQSIPAGGSFCKLVSVCNLHQSTSLPRLCSTVHDSAVWCTMQYSAVWCTVHDSAVWCTMQYSAVWCTVQYSALWFTVQYGAQCITVQYSNVRWSKVLCTIQSTPCLFYASCCVQVFQPNALRNCSPDFH